MVMLGTSLFIRSWEQGEKLYLSMNSRCYDGKLIVFNEKKPVKYPELVLTLFYFSFIIIIFYYTKDISIV
jgi:cobalt/nickel transport system permease protein